MTQVVANLRDVHLTYHAFEDSQAALRSRVSTGSLRRRRRAIHAIRGVSLIVNEGDAVGIVGANGSGKSTLLRALAGLLPTDSGEILVRSRPVLLGVGAALRPQLSGRRNILIGCLALGMRRDEVQERVSEIIEFAGLAEFIDLPMKTYSSGMRARLAFSIATARRPDILLVDEALAVGDQAFRKRSQERMLEIRQAAGAVVLVSHNPAEIKSSCNRAVWLDHGVKRREGHPSDIIAEYSEFIESASA